MTFRALSEIFRKNAAVGEHSGCSFHSGEDAFTRSTASWIRVRITKMGPSGCLLTLKRCNCTLPLIALFWTDLHQALPFRIASHYPAPLLPDKVFFFSPENQIFIAQVMHVCSTFRTPCGFPCRGGASRECMRCSRFDEAGPFSSN